MAVPTKRIPDTLLQAIEAAQADLNPHLSALATGGFTVGYDDNVPGLDINAYGLREQADGTNFGTLDASSNGNDNETSQSRYGLAGGNVVMVWTDTPTATNDSDIKALFTNLDSGARTTPFLVNVGDTAGNQVRPEVAELRTGNLAFAWIDTTASQVTAAVFDSFGAAITTNIAVSTTLSSQNTGTFDLGMTPLANGNFAVSWRTDDFHEHFRIINAAGSFATNDIAVPAASAGAGDIIQLADGTIEIVYRSSGGLLRGQAYDTSGNLLGAEYLISSTDSDRPAATALQDGRFMAVYEENGDIFGRIMNRDGTPSTDEFRVNTDPTGTQTHATIDTLSDGQVAVAWEDSRTGAGDIYYTMYDLRQAGADLTGGNRADSLAGSNFDDTLTGGLSADYLRGGGGSDTFVFKNPTDGTDRIADFQHGQDHVLLGSNFVSEGGGPHPLSSAVHFDYGSAATTSSPTVIYDTFNSHQLKWDSDGTGPAPAQALAIVNFADASDTIEPDRTFFSLPGLNGYSVLGTGDFNHNGGVDSDIVLRNNASGNAEIWFMGGGAIIGDYSIGNLGGYSLAGTGDFNHDGTDDILWRNNASGVVEAWLMQDGVRVGDNILGNLSGYTALGTGDFNHDGTTDIVWQNNASGVVDIWLMGAGHMTADVSPGNLSGYTMLGIGDFNGDGTSDFVWRNNASGLAETWLMQQGVRTGGFTLGNLANYQLIDTGDLNHDGTDDLVWRASNGVTSSWAMRNGQFQNDEQNLGNFPVATNPAVAFGDFTGDGGKDVLFLNPGANTTTIVDIEHHSLVASDLLIS
jgi:hypothetical protein